MRHTTANSMTFALLRGALAASLLCLGMHAMAHAASRSLSIPNFDADSPACSVSVNAELYRCTAAACTVPVSKSPGERGIAVRLTCLPSSAPTGFENPAPGVKVTAIAAQNAKGLVSLIDELRIGAAPPTSTLTFCLFGGAINLCSIATLARVRGAKLDDVDAVQRFIRTLELQTAPPPQP
jgi:hypothetical protein